MFETVKSFLRLYKQVLYQSVEYLILITSPFFQYKFAVCLEPQQHCQ